MESAPFFPIFAHMKRVMMLLTLLVAVTACDSFGIISQKKMSKIYYDMYVVDSYLEHMPELRLVADSTYVYEAIFEKYGCDSTGFFKSLQYYLDNPKKMRSILNDAKSMLKERERELDVMYHMDPDSDEYLRHLDELDALPSPDDPNAPRPRPIDKKSLKKMKKARKQAEKRNGGQPSLDISDDEEPMEKIVPPTPAEVAPRPVPIDKGKEKKRKLRPTEEEMPGAPADNVK